MKRRTGSFQATGSDGRSYTVEVWAIFRDAGAGEATGREELYTSSGAAVVRVQEGEYRVVTTGVRLRPAGPAAPGGPPGSLGG
ncbi:MAG TPA: hypothetical protein VFE78_31680 [Gemmataceae bacterium]|jgi:hypothetical protein|nr:hypothetical protein [Gemmataceae bacterium]